MQRNLSCMWWLGVTFLSLILPVGGYAQDVLVNLENISPYEIKVGGFRLDSRQNVEIEGVAFRGSRRHGFTRAWILDSKTRSLVWELEDANVNKKSRRLIRVEDRVSLARGNYEVYYSSYPFHYSHDDRFGDFFSKIFDGVFSNERDYDDVYHEFKNEWDEFRIEVRGRGESFSEWDVSELQDDFLHDAFVTMKGLRDGENQQFAFELSRRTDIQIYAIGEAERDATFDYGWIINTKTREKVWKFTYDNSRHAGGAEKNRMVNTSVSLPKGKYMAFFVTDDSHSTDDWNSAPPYDPYFWGLTLRVKDRDRLEDIREFDPRERNEKNVVVEFTRLGDNEFRSQGFTCKKNIDVRIYAIGEGNRKRMFDYSWIVSSDSHKKVWEMAYYNTEHAGGGEKNRLFDGIVHLLKGNYIVYSVTDDSHSYWDWNTSPPYDQNSWGITILGASQNFDADDIEEYAYRDEGKILAQLTRMRDHERERERFTLKKDNEVRIYAIGEGSHGHMYDYCWIETAQTNRVVWEMTYRKTQPAGGAEKNRLVDDTIFLRKGDYILFFESDDSHSYDDWNMPPPYDPNHWGVTLYLKD